MSGPALLVDLTPGAQVLLDGVEWTVTSLAPHLGEVVLRRADGAQRCTTVRALVNDPGCRQSAGSAAGRGRQPVTLADLTTEQQELVRLRFAHVQEAETGFRSGDVWHAAPGEPRPAYDPQRTTLTERRLAKVAEIRGLGPEVAARIGFAHISERTLKRLGAACRRYGMVACINGSWVRRSGGRPSMTEPVREAIFAVRRETLHRSRISMRTRERLIHQYVRERYGTDLAVPSYPTLRRVWREWFGPGGTRPRYQHSAATAAAGTGEHVVVHRPGQVVALDTTVLPVKVRETVFGDPVSVHLTLALDAYTHSLVAFRLTLVSDMSVDVAMLLRDMVMPLPLREGWGEEMVWPYPGVPASVVAEFAGHPVAALPFFPPETVTTDHGSVYRNHHLVEVQRVLGTNILPSRVLRPTDKQALERAFGAIQSLLFELLPGYTGVDVADRGADPDGDAVLTIAEMEHLIATFAVGVWQNRQLSEHAPAWDPDGRHSPNSLFAAAMAQGGFALQIPGPELFYELLPAHHVMIHGRRGVKIRGLWYNGPALDSYRGTVSTRGGRHKGEWVVRRDPRDRRTVFFQDPKTHDWHSLRWTGLPPEGEVPSFSDARVRDLLAAARRAGLRPRSDAELLPLLLDLIGAHVPVEAWPTRMGKTERVAHAREAAQAQAAAADRPASTARNIASSQPTGPATATPAPAPGDRQGWRQRAQLSQRAADSDRAHRRGQALAGQSVSPPPRLGDAFRRRNLFLLPAEDDTDPDRSTPDEYGPEAS
jgi:hypothetical protein